MTPRARKVCASPGCPMLALAGGSLCGSHEQAREHKYNARRPSAARQGYGAKWRQASARFLAEHPLCVCGRGHRSTVVDHIQPHRGDQKLFWDESNWQAMAKTCHDRKTALQDGGFGNARPAVATK